MSLASYVYFSEEQEEDRRVSQVGRHRLPPRWFVPRPEEHYQTWRGQERTRFLRPAEAFVLPGGKMSIEQVSDEARGERPVLISEFLHQTPEENMAALLKMGPTNTYLVYRKAIDEGQLTVAELIPVVVAKLFRAGELNRRTVKAIRNTFGALAEQEPIAERIAAAVSPS